MLERVSILYQGDGIREPLIDPGALAEALLYFGEAHLLTSKVTLDLLIRAVGADTLLELLKQPQLKISYRDLALPAVQTKSLDGVQIYAPGYFQAIESDGTPKYPHERVVEETVNSLFGHTRKRFSQALATKISIANTPMDLGAQALDELVTDPTYTRAAIPVILRHLAPEYRLPSDFQFCVHPHRGSRSIETDLDFEAITAASPVPAPNGNITPSLLLLNLQTARCVLQMATMNSAELSTAPLTADLVALKVSRIVQRASGQEQIQLFQEHVLHNARAVREAINSGRRSFNDLLPLLEEADKFRNFMKNVSFDQSLLANYIAALEQHQRGFMESLPVKVLRLLVVSAAGVVLGESLGVPGALAGLGLSAIDTFLADGLSKGYKPNAFVNELQRFTGPSLIT